MILESEALERHCGMGVAYRNPWGASHVLPRLLRSNSFCSRIPKMARHVKIEYMTRSNLRKERVGGKERQERGSRKNLR